MPVNDSITGLANASITIARTTRVPPVNGRRVAGTTTTVGPIDIVIQPAFNLNRVIGGADLNGTVENQQIEEIFQIHSTEPLYAGQRIAGATQYEPDIVTWDGQEWTVARVESPWDLTGERHWHAVITRRTGGGS